MNLRDVIAGSATVPSIMVVLSIGSAVLVIGLFVLVKRSGRHPKARAIFPVLWPTAQNYDQFRALCDDELPRTLDGYVATWGPTEDFVDRGGGKFVKVPFDPKLMAQWCRSKFGKVDQAAREA